VHATAGVDFFQARMEESDAKATPEVQLGHLPASWKTGRVV